MVLAGGADRVHLGMRGRIVVPQHAVAARRQDFTVAHDDAAERPAGLLNHAGLAHQFDRVAHMRAFLFGRGRGRAGCGKHLAGGRGGKQRRSGCQKTSPRDDMRVGEQRFEIVMIAHVACPAFQLRGKLDA